MNLTLKCIEFKKSILNLVEAEIEDIRKAIACQIIEPVIVAELELPIAVSSPIPSVESKEEEMPVMLNISHLPILPKLIEQPLPMDFRLQFFPMARQDLIIDPKLLNMYIDLQSQIIPPLPVQPKYSRIDFDKGRLSELCPPYRFPKKRTHMDHLIQEVLFVSTDFRQERRWKIAKFRELASSAANRHNSTNYELFDLNSSHNTKIHLKSVTLRPYQTTTLKQLCLSSSCHLSGPPSSGKTALVSVIVMLHVFEKKKIMLKCASTYINKWMYECLVRCCHQGFNAASIFKYLSIVTWDEEEEDDVDGIELIVCDYRKSDLSKKYKPKKKTKMIVIGDDISVDCVIQVQPLLLSAVHMNSVDDAMLTARKAYRKIILVSSISCQYLSVTFSINAIYHKSRIDVLLFELAREPICLVTTIAKLKFNMPCTADVIILPTDSLDVAYLMCIKSVLTYNNHNHYHSTQEDASQFNRNSTSIFHMYHKISLAFSYSSSSLISEKMLISAVPSHLRKDAGVAIESSPISCWETGGVDELRFVLKYEFGKRKNLDSDVKKKKKKNLPGVIGNQNLLPNSCYCKSRFSDYLPNYRQVKPIHKLPIPPVPLATAAPINRVIANKEPDEVWTVEDDLFVVHNQPLIATFGWPVLANKMNMNNFNSWLIRSPGQCKARYASGSSSSSNKPIMSFHQKSGQSLWTGLLLPSVSMAIDATPAHSQTSSSSSSSSIVFPHLVSHHASSSTSNDLIDVGDCYPSAAYTLG